MLYNREANTARHSRGRALNPCPPPRSPSPDTLKGPALWTNPHSTCTDCGSLHSCPRPSEKTQARLGQEDVSGSRTCPGVSPTTSACPPAGCAGTFHARHDGPRLAFQHQPPASPFPPPPGTLLNMGSYQAENPGHPMPSS